MNIVGLKKYLSFVKTRWFALIAGLLIGSLVILGIRFFTYKPNEVHYHANFAAYIDGQQEQFKSPLNYEETEMCAINTGMTPGMRAHMHDGVNSVVHVEDHAVTWGQFFANINWIVGDNFISSFGKMYQADDQHKLTVTLNGQDMSLAPITNTVIKDQDKLLISYGNHSEAQLKTEYDAIPSTAHKYDVTKDPASCSGNHSTSMHKRLMNMF